VGSSISLRVDIFNDGPAAATGVTVHFGLPAGYTFLGVAHPGGEPYDVTTGLWTVGAIGSGRQFTLMLSARVNAAGPYELLAAVAASSEPDPDPANNTATATPTPDRNADLALSFEIPPPAAPPIGSHVHFLLRVDNKGPAATTGVRVRFPLPAGYTFAGGAPDRGSYDSTTGEWVIGALSTAARFFLTVSINAAGPYNLTATITGTDAPDPNLANNTLTAAVVPDRNADLAISFEIPPPSGTLTVGTLVSFLVRVENRGPAFAAGVTARFQLPAGYTFSGGTPDRGSYDITTGDWTIGPLALTAARFFLQATVNPTGPMNLTAAITASDAPDPNLANNTVTFPPPNRPPVANAGLDQSSATNATVLLDASLSTDGDGDPLTFQWALVLRPASSAAALAGAGTATPSFTPDQGGRYIAQLTVTDSHGVASLAPDAVTINAEVLNLPPAIVSTAVTAGAVGQPYAYQVRAHDPDAADVLTFSLAEAPAGMAIHATTGLVDWTPSDAQGGPQPVTVRVQDLAGLFATQSFAVQVSSASNHAPVALDDAFEVRLDESLGVSAPGILANDSDADGDALTPALLTQPANGTVSFNADGSFTYTPHVVREGDLIFLEGVNLATRVPGATVAVSSTEFGTTAIDAADDDLGTSWRASGFDTVPFVEVSFPQDVTVVELQVFGYREPFLVDSGFRNTVGFFQLFAADGSELFHSGGVDLPAPRGDTRQAVPGIAGVRRARFSITEVIGERGLADFKVIGSALLPRPGAAEPNLGLLLPAAAQASSFVSGSPPEMGIDGSTASNWYASSGAAGEFLEYAYPVETTVSRIQVTNPSARPDGFGTSERIECSGNFVLFGSDGAVLFDSGVLGEPSGFVSSSDSFTLAVPDVLGVRRVRWTSAGCATAIQSGFSEFRVFGTAAVAAPAIGLARKFHALLGREVHSTPIVVNLTDDNFDGRIDARDVPDIVVPVESPGNQLKGEIKAVSGDDGRELFTAGGPDLVSPWSEAAVGDLDGDGIPEIVAVHSDGNHLIAFDTTGGIVHGNLTQLSGPLTLEVSSSFAGFPPERAVDGNLGTSWFTARGDAVNQGGSPFFQISFQQDVTVTELRMFGNREFASGFDFLAGAFQLLAADGTVLFDSGVVSLPAPDRDVVLPIPSVSGVRRVRFTATADEGTEPGFAELEVIGPVVVPKGAAKIRWISDPNPMPRFDTADGVGNPVAFIGGAVSIANLDGGPRPHVIVGASVFDADGKLLGDGRALGGTTGGTGLRTALSAVADLDLDGGPEIVAGPTAYRLVDGALTKVWQRADRPEGYVAIANLDDDPFPEIVVAGNGQIAVLNHDGTDAEVWNPPTHAAVPIPGGGFADVGGAPTVADLDGDGVAEIGIAAAVNYFVFNRDGTIRWRRATSDRSSRSTGSTVFDLDGDGEVEVLYRDEVFLRVYRGADGVLLASIPVGSSTWAEQPVVADVDNDGHAEIVVSSDRQLANSVTDTGVYVLEDLADNWTRTRRIWNQHAYHVTNVNEDGTIPRVETPHWLLPGLNSFRLNAFLGGENPDQADSFTYRVSDGSLESNVARVRIAVRTPNSAPNFTSTPITNAATGLRYTYAAQASDPDPSDILTFSLPSAPEGMTIDSLSGVLQWTPTAGQGGTHAVVVKVHDVGGLFALQGYDVTVGAPVTVPDVVGQPQAAAEAAIAAATLTVGPITTRNSPTVPAGSVLAQIPAAGALVALSSPVSLVVSLGPAPVGTVPDVVGQSQAAAQIDIAAAGFRAGAITRQHSTVFPLDVVIAQDPAAGTLAAPDSPVSLLVSLGLPPGDRDQDGDGFTPGQGDCDDTAAAIHPGAADEPGDGIDQDCNGADAVAGDDAPPTVSIDSPPDGAAVTYLTDILGRVNDANLMRYSLEFAPVDGASLTRLASGTTPVTGLLGRLDPTLLENALYRVRLVAEDVNGHLAADEKIYRVTGLAKVGVMAMSFVDLQVPVSGIPITVVRSYDSRVKTQRDFGVGWSLGIKTGTYQNNRKPGVGWTITKAPGPLGLPCQLVTETRSHFTEIRLSDREFYLFRTTLKNPTILVGGCLATAAFEFVGGTTQGARLEIAGSSDVLYTSGDVVTDFGNGLDSGLVYEPQAVRLTTADGRTTEFHRLTGVTRIEDAKGNTLTISAGGIVHSTGKSIAFQRDERGRIARIIDPSGRDLRYSYDARGDLATFTDRMGNVTTFEYDALHNLTLLRDPLNRGLRYEYDGDGRLVRMIDGDNNAIKFEHDLANLVDVETNELGHTTVRTYDTDGNIVAERNARGAITRATFDGANNMLTETDPVGNTKTYTYDLSGNRLSQSDGLGHRYRSTYNEQNRLTSLVDPAGAVTAYTYDRFGNVLSTTDPAGARTTYAYDARGLVRAITDAQGHTTIIEHDQHGQRIRKVDPLGAETRYAYDANGNRVVERLQVRSESGIVPRVMTFTYDANGNVSSQSDSEGGVTRFENDAGGNTTASVDALGRRVEITHRGNQIAAIRWPDGRTIGREFDAAARLAAYTDRGGRRSIFQLDPVGNLNALLYADATPADDGDNPRLTTEFDAADRLSALVSEAGHRTAFELDAAGQTIGIVDALGDRTSMTYDGVGRQTSRVDGLGRETRFEYDVAGNLTRTVHADGSSIRHVYDSLGRRVATIDQLERSWAYEYDAVGRLVGVLDPLGNRTEYRYDDAGNLLSQRDALGRQTSFDYDSLGRRTAVVLPLGQREQVSYDVLGRRASLRDFNGNEIRFEYDALNRLIRKEYSDGGSVAFSYTATGRRERAVDAAGKTAWEYDSRDGLVGRTEPDGSRIEYEVFPDGLASTVIGPFGTVRYEYDGKRRLTALIDRDGHRTSYGYDAADNLVRTERPDGTVESRQYDALDRVTSVVNHHPLTGTVSSHAYAYDARGNLTTVTEQAGRSVEYTYDALDRLIREDVNDPVAGDRVFEHVYDAVGNRIETRDSVVGTTAFSYDANDRLARATHGSITTTFTYDNSGNPLSATETSGDSVTYRWDLENRLASATSMRGGVTQSLRFGYDVDGIRVSRTVDGVETRFLMDHKRAFPQVLAEYTVAHDPLVTYAVGLSRVSQDRGGVKSFYAHDGHSGIRAMVSATGTVTDRYVYDGYGALIGESGTSTNEFLYRGEQAERSLDLMYLRARYYDPRNARFLGIDPEEGAVEDPLARHRYLYARDNPLRFQDPSGRQNILEMITANAVHNVLVRLALIGAGMAIGQNIRGPGESGRVEWEGQMWTFGTDMPFAHGKKLGAGFEATRALGGALIEADAQTCVANKILLGRKAWLFLAGGSIAWQPTAALGFTVPLDAGSGLYHGATPAFGFTSRLGRNAFTGGALLLSGAAFPVVGGVGMPMGPLGGHEATAVLAGFSRGYHAGSSVGVSPVLDLDALAGFSVTNYSKEPIDCTATPSP
jgi:RHS repeat-associated protein